MDARATPQVGFDANKIRALIAKYLEPISKLLTGRDPL